MNKRLIKIVYFDEDAAIDYITISDGGKAINEIINTSEDSDSSTTEGETSTGFSIPFLNWFNIKAKIGVEANITNLNDEIVRSTISNTILTDYIDKVENDNAIAKFDNYDILPIDDSVSYYRMYTPYMLLIKKELNDKISPEIDVTKIDDVLKEVKGYYEFLARKGAEEVIIRFNINSFKNNYKINNILGMNLVLYGVKVGCAELNDFSIEKEFKVKEERVSAEELLGKKESDIDNLKLPIYDIVLAGVSSEE